VRAVSEYSVDYNSLLSAQLFVVVLVGLSLPLILALALTVVSALYFELLQSVNC